MLRMQDIWIYILLKYIKTNNVLESDFQLKQKVTTTLQLLKHLGKPDSSSSTGLDTTSAFEMLLRKSELREEFDLKESGLIRTMV